MVSDLISGVRYAAIALSCISAISSLVVVISYIRMLLQFRAHQQRILESAPDTQQHQQQHQEHQGAGVLPAAAAATTCFSCESSLATPCISRSFFSPYHKQQQQQHIPMQQLGLSAVHPQSISNRYSMPSQVLHTGTATPARTSAASRNTSTDRQGPLCASANEWVTVIDEGGDGSRGGSSGGSGCITAGVKQSNAQSSSSSGGALSLGCHSQHHRHGKDEHQSTKQGTTELAASKKPRKRCKIVQMLAYRNPVSKTISLDKVDNKAAGDSPLKYRRRKRLPRIPSSKIAMLSGIDLLLHFFWIVNTTAATTDTRCTATMFFYQWIQLFYLFFLSTFVSRSAMRLRNLQPALSQSTRRTDMLYCVSTLAMSCILSLLPAIMTSARYNAELGTCWFSTNNATALRWVWVSLNTWVVAAVLFLIATSVYVSVILSNERRDLLSFIVPATTAAGTSATAIQHKADGLQPIFIPAFEPRLSQNFATTPPFHQYASSRPYHRHQWHHFSQQPQAAAATKAINTAAMFGVRSTPLSSKDSLGLHQVSSAAHSGGIQRKEYPATHPVSLAHEALHGRRPAPTQSRESPVLNIQHQRYSSMAMAGTSRRATQSTCGQHIDSPRRSSTCSSSSGNNNTGSSICEHCRRHRESLSSHGSCGMYSLPSLRHRSDIVTAGQYHRGIAGRRQMVWGDSSGTGSRPSSVIAGRLPRLSVAAIGYAGGSSGLTNDSESSKLASIHPWDSNRRLLHKRSYSPTTASSGICGRSLKSHYSVSSARLHPADSPLPQAAILAHRSIADTIAGGYLAGASPKLRRIAKHMSMPLGAATANLAAARERDAEYQQGQRRQLSGYQESGLPATPHRHYSTGAVFADSRPALPHQPNMAVPASAAPPLPQQETGHRKRKNMSLEVLDNTAATTSVPSAPSPTTEPAAKLRVAFDSLRASGHWAKDKVLNKKPMGAAPSHIQRVERRVKLLVATGALRVGTRALVPLLTQLGMVVWSTLQATGVHQQSRETAYAVAALLLSMQGTLDMALYYIFDTQMDTSDASLSYYFPPSSHRNIFATGNSSSRMEFLHSGSFLHHPQQQQQVQQLRRPSLIHLQSDVYYVDRRLSDCQPPINPHRYHQHHNHHNRQYGLGISLDRKHQRQQQSQLAQSAAANSTAPSSQAATPAFHRRSLSLVSVNVRRGTGNGSSTSGGVADAAGQKFTFNVDSLNMRRINRSSNAMQSDTLNGSDNMAWSHLDDSGMSVRGDTASILQYSPIRGGAPVPHHRHIMPVLNGWEEVELEETSPPASELAQLEPRSATASRSGSSPSAAANEESSGDNEDAESSISAWKASILA
ncbi:hypothetical protein GQ54DRAFT_305451 [Martensiomyces pterosporus]|nr:hypothetical protein GQ54DRAFT_305451 [Martensiomyces pterosporus]